jgi:prevent-host-death family protein
MVTVGVRQLKEKASELIRLVREDKDVILITYHGKVVAKMTPVEPVTVANETESAWVSLEKLAAEIGKSWPEGISAADALAEDRR